MSTGRFFDRTIPFWGFHGSSEVLQTLLVAPPSWIQDGGAGNDVNQDLGRPFRSPLWRWRKMAALPLPAAILDDLIPRPGNWEWGHPRWRPEAEGPPSCATATMGIEKAALYYSFAIEGYIIDWLILLFTRVEGIQIYITSTKANIVKCAQHITSTF